MSEPRRSYEMWPAGKGRASCTAETGEGPAPWFVPRVCGFAATTPHPDPERSYREPLCWKHYDEAEAALSRLDGPS